MPWWAWVVDWALGGAIGLVVFLVLRGVFPKHEKDPPSQG